MATYSVELFQENYNMKLLNESDLDIDEITDKLIDFYFFSDEYSDADLYEYLEGLDEGTIELGDDTIEFKITKKL